MQRVIISLFCPAIVAIVVRIVLWLIGFALNIIGLFGDKGSDLRKLQKTGEAIAQFDTFTWENSWGFWVIVIIVTFIAEYVIWDDDTYNDFTK